MRPVRGPQAGPGPDLRLRPSPAAPGPGGRVVGCAQRGARCARARVARVLWRYSGWSACWRGARRRLAELRSAPGL